ncbi:outer membrane lipoprotein-sorting protein [Acidobacteriota bacterium]
MRRILCIALLLAVLIPVKSGIFAQDPTADWILNKVDENFGSDNKIMESEMIIHGRRGSRTITSKSWVQGLDKSFTEYLSPPREKGTKMLKLEDQLWTYTPSTDRTIRISGHMLRQSVMGSDLSYEDMMEDPKLENLYNAQIVEEEAFMDRPCWVLELTSKGEEITYYKRKVWVDKERFVSLKENLYAKSGKLLKTTEVYEVFTSENRWIPRKAVFKDVLKKGKGTEWHILSMEFNADIPDHVFTKASLRR